VAAVIPAASVRLRLMARLMAQLVDRVAVMETPDVNVSTRTASQG
jgi:hypothetical protein